MSIMIVRVDWSGVNTDGTTTTSFTLDDVESITIKKDSEAKASSATIILKNSYDRILTGFNQPFTKYNSNTNNIRFKEGDSVKIYAAQIESYREIDTTVTSPDLLMSGEISEVNIKSSPNGAKVTLTIVDKTYIILNRINPEVYTLSQSLSSPELVKDVIRNVTDNVESDALSYDNSGNLVYNGKYEVDARLVSEGGFIEDTRQDGTDFPINSLGMIKPAYTWVQELSSVEMTNNFDGRDTGLDTDDEDAPVQNRNMLFYVDELNRFHWYYPRDIVTTTLNGNINDSVTTITLTNASSFPTQGSIFIGTERIDYTGKSTNDLTGCTRGANNTNASSHTSGDTVKNGMIIIEGDTSSGYTLYNYNLTKKTFDIVNFVIFSCGADMVGNGITSFFFDRTTKSKTLKDTFKAYSDIAKDLIQKEIDLGNITLDNATSSYFFYNGNRYKETTGDYDSGGGITTSWGIVVTTDEGYNAAFRTEAIRRGTSKAQMLTQKRGSPRWKGTMEFKFHRFTAGEIFEFTSTRAGINQQTLRIKTAQYNLTKSGMFCSLTVEEDEEKLGVT